MQAIPDFIKENYHYRTEREDFMSVTIVVPYEDVQKNVHAWAIEEESIDFRRNHALATRCTVSFAATELEAYLKKIGFDVSFADAAVKGAQNIVLAFDSEKGDACDFTLTPTKDGVLVRGATRVGVLYGAYEVLRLQGVRWLTPDEDVVPASVAALVLPTAEKSYSPSMPLGRGFDFEGPLKDSPRLWLWMARNRLNLSTYRPYTHKYQKKLGMIFKNGGHIFEAVLDPDNYTEDGRTFWEAHPEWYGAHDKSNALNTQFCTSDESLLTFLSEEVLRRATTDWYDADRIDVWGFDTWGECCQCEACRARGNGSDTMLHFLSFLRDYTDKAVADGRLDHDVKYSMCAYEGTATLQPPMNGVPENLRHSGDSVTYYPIFRCYEHQFYDPTCAQNNRFREALEGWHDIPVMMGEYYNVSKFEDLPLLFNRTIGNDLKFYYEHGVSGMTYMHLPMREWGVRNITQLLYAQLSWDINTDVKAFIDQYYKDRYGDAADEVRQAYERIESAFVDISSWRNWNGDCVLQQLLNDWNGERPTALLKEDDHLAGNAEKRGDEILALLREAFAILKGVHREQVISYSKNVALVTGRAVNPLDMRYASVGVYVERLEEDMRLLKYGIDSMELLVLFLQYHNAWYRGEGYEEIWEKLDAACREAVLCYTPVAHCGAHDIRLEERDVLERCQLKGLYYKIMKNRV